MSEQTGFHVRQSRYTLAEVWDGNTCVSDRVFNGYGPKIVEAMTQLRMLQDRLAIAEMALDAIAESELGATTLRETARGAMRAIANK